MPRSVFKYPFAVTDDHAGVVLPAGAAVLHYDRDPAFPAGTGQLAVWAMVDTDTPRSTPLRLHVTGTGHPLPEGVDAPAWRSTVIDGPFVWHVFEAAR